MHYNVQQQHSKITDISTLQFIHKSHNFMHIVSMQSSGAAITRSGSCFGRIHWLIPGHIWFGPDFKKFESGTSLKNCH